VLILFTRNLLRSGAGISSALRLCTFNYIQKINTASLV
jgi:hypothetical protein